MSNDKDPVTNRKAQTANSESKPFTTKAPFDCAPFDHAQGLRQGRRKPEDTKEEYLTDKQNSFVRATQSFRFSRLTALPALDEHPSLRRSVKLFSYPFSKIPSVSSVRDKVFSH